MNHPPNPNWYPSYQYPNQNPSYQYPNQYPSNQYPNQYPSNQYPNQYPPYINPNQYPSNNPNPNWNPQYASPSTMVFDNAASGESEILFAEICVRMHQLAKKVDDARRLCQEMNLEEAVPMLCKLDRAREKVVNHLRKVKPDFDRFYSTASIVLQAVENLGREDARVKNGPGQAEGGRNFTNGRDASDCDEDDDDSDLAGEVRNY